MQVSLRVLLQMLGLPATRLHNGGNDARYTMEALLALCRVAQVDDPPPRDVQTAGNHAGLPKQPQPAAAAVAAAQL